MPKKTAPPADPKWYDSLPDIPPVSDVALGSRDWRTYFCRAFVVNLDRRPDRLEQFYKGIPGDWPFCPVKRYVAVDGQNVAVPKDWKSGAGAYGLYCTYRDIIQQAITEGWDKPVLLFEDDCLFVPGFAQRAIERMERLPVDWDALWLGGQLYGKVMPHDRGVVRALKPHRTHSFAIAPQFFETVLKIWKEHWGHVDHAITRCAVKFRIMAFDPPLTAQGGGMSNIAGRKKNVEYWDHRTRTMFRRGT